MRTATFTCPVSAIVMDGELQRWLGWYIDIDVPMLESDEAPVVVRAGESEMVHFRAHEGRLHEPLRRNGHLDVYTTKSFRIEPVDMRTRRTADTMNGQIGRHFIDFPMRFPQPNVSGSGGFIELSADAEERFPICAEAAAWVRQKVQECIVVDGSIWKQSVGPRLLMFINKVGPVDKVKAAIWTGRTPMLDDVDALSHFSAFDAEEAKAAFKAAYSEFEDATRFPIEILSEDGWDKEAVRLNLRARALAAVGLRLCHEASIMPMAALDDRSIAAYAALRGALENIVTMGKDSVLEREMRVANGGPRTVKTDFVGGEDVLVHHELPRMVEELLDVFGSKVNARKATGWRTTIEACKTTGPRYVDLVGLSI